MELIALRYTFTGVDGYGKPFGEPLRVCETNERGEEGSFGAEGIWRTTTHDRGEESGHRSKAFFQLCFRITGEGREGCKVALIAPDKTIPLYYDEENDLWYQRTKYDNDSRPVVDTESGVNFISTAGVFTVSVIKADGRPVISKRVVVSPSLIDDEGYKTMLDRLISINENLIISGSSYVGAGKNARPYRDSHKVGEWDHELWNDLKPQLEAIMKIPPELLRKEYISMPAEKNRHYDSRVMRSIGRSVGRIEGISFIGDNDTYENRAIRFILSRLGGRKERSVREVGDIAWRIHDDVADTFDQADADVLDKKIAITGEHDTSAMQHFYLRINPVKAIDMKVKVSLSYYPQNGMILIESNRIDGTQWPFCNPSDESTPIKIKLETLSADTALKFLDWIFRIFQTIELSNAGDKRHDIVIHGVKKSLISNCLKLTDFIPDDDLVSFFDDSELASGSVLLKDFYRKAMEISQKYGSDNLTIHNNSEQNKDYFDIICYIAGRKQRYAHLADEAEADKRYNSVIMEMREMLNEKWFRGITQLSHLELPLKLTPKFSFNRYYRAVYELLQSYIGLHPLLTTDLDLNAIGLKETCRIYEYWVFCEILQRFTNLGFVITDDAAVTIRNKFAEFIASDSKPEGFMVPLSRKYELDGVKKSVDILLGYNMMIGEADYKKGGHLTPDVFIRVTHNDKKAYNWYFLDMKYKRYSRNSTDRFNDLDSEVLNVAKGKYIDKIGSKNFTKIFCERMHAVDPELWDTDFRNNINGAYLIVAQIEESEEEIAENDRLGGGVKEIKHKYGAIEFNPGHENELTTLIELIFEYKENEEELENYGDGTHNRPDTLCLCWDSSVDHRGLALPDVEVRGTSGKYFKFYVTCPCGAMRFENHCKDCHQGILKRDEGNYHKRNNKHNSGNKLWKWNYICPECGEKL